MRSPILSLRFYTADFGDATVGQVKAALVNVAEVVSEEREPYWKIPEWLEVRLTLTPLKEYEQAFAEVPMLLGGNWEQSGDGPHREALWSDQVDSSLFIPTIKWAIVQLIKENEEASPE